MNILKNSFIVRAVIMLFKAYQNSKLAVFFSAVAMVYKNSLTYKAFEKYFNKKMAYEASLLFKVQNALFAFLNKAARGLGNWLRGITQGSAVCDEAVSTVKGGFGVGAFFVALLGVAVGAFINSLVSGGSVFLPACAVVALIVCVFIGSHISYVKQSVIYRFIVWLVE